MQSKLANIPGLYIHVPFCPTICPYCDFHVVMRHGDAVEKYLDRLEGEALDVFGRYPGPFETIYFGGGTPSFLRNQELRRLGKIIQGRFGAESEVTLEANPGTLNPERLQILRDIGINRLSVGVQSFDDGVLKTLGRAHGSKGAYRAVEQALEAGFRVSVDLILGLPGQDLALDLKTATKLGVEHVSAYTLLIEPGTPFELAGLEENGDLEANAFDNAESILGEAGFIRYEVSNFAKPGKESRHNLLYWQNNYWAALGPGATGQFPNANLSFRETNPPLPRWLVGEKPLQEEVSKTEAIKESLMLGLRTRNGVDLAQLEERYKFPLQTLLDAKIQRMLAQNLIEIESDWLRVTSLSRVHGVVLELWEGLES